MAEVFGCPFCGAEVIAYKGLMGITMFRCTNRRTCGAVISFDSLAANAGEPPINLFNRRIKIEFIPIKTRRKKKG